jgi:hypothetical protein
MKKSRYPKLTLSRETISVLDRSLQPDEMARVPGGASSPTLCQTCFTCQDTTCLTCPKKSICIACQ